MQAEHLKDMVRRFTLDEDDIASSGEIGHSPELVLNEQPKIGLTDSAHDDFGKY
jgi:hypothetical protein